jgi:hypothetical protein
LLQALPDTVAARWDTLLTAAYPLPGLPHCHAASLDVGEELALLLQFSFLTGDELRGPYLARLVCQQVAPSSELLLICQKRLEAVSGVGKLACDPGKLGAQRGCARIGIQKRKLFAHVKKGELLVGAVQIERRGCELSQRAHRSESPVYGSAAPACALHLSAEYHGAGRLIGAGGRDLSLDDCGGSSAPNDLLADPPSEQDIERIEHERLAGACLSGEDVQSGGGAPLEVVDDTEVANRESFQHLATAPGTVERVGIR